MSVSFDPPYLLKMRTASATGARVFSHRLWKRTRNLKAGTVFMIRARTLFHFEVRSTARGCSSRSSSISSGRLRPDFLAPEVMTVRIPVPTRPVEKFLFRMHSTHRRQQLDFDHISGHRSSGHGHFPKLRHHLLWLQSRKPQLSAQCP
jgi:hypothetical protein